MLKCRKTYYLSKKRRYTKNESYIKSADRILLTFDKDFGELAFRSKLPATTGIILFRIKAPSGAVVAEKVARVIALRDDWHGHFSVVEDDKIRMRSFEK